MQSSSFKMQDKWIALSAFLLLLLAYHFMLGPYFPTTNGTLGHDYSRVLPDLLDGYFWINNNGFFEPFWFTPSFCGGQPTLADPVSTFYSVAQFLALLLDPIASIYSTALLFASLGFWGFYLLLRSCFGTSTQAAVLGGALFMLNGFFLHRMMVGHFIYHGMMLIPFIAWFLLRPVEKNSVSGTLLNGAAAAFMLAYGVYSGLISLLLPCAAAIFAIVCIHGAVGRTTHDLFSRLVIAALFTTGMSAAKLVATLSFLHYFPRNDYLLPGIASMWDEAHLFFYALFFAPADIARQAQPLLVNAQWELSRHEWEFGVTVVPLLVILAGTVAGLKRINNGVPRVAQVNRAWLALLVLVLALPVALNVYSPNWNAFLKEVPLIKSSSNLLRWLLIYIPAVIVFSALHMDRITTVVSRRNGILATALFLLILINIAKDRDYYQSQPYRPDTIVSAWWAAQTAKIQPRIRNISAFFDENNRIEIRGNGNDMIASGASQLACYNATFGYRLENFPIKSLHPGPVLNETNGLLNLKNPACYLYPSENECTPGEHFTTAQREAAESFAAYKPYPFNFSASQKIANLMTLATLILLALLFAVTLSKGILKRLKTRSDTIRS